MTILATCPDQPPSSIPVNVYLPKAVLMLNGFRPDRDDPQPYTYLLDHGWTFPSGNPFTAELQATMPDQAIGGDVKVTMTHQPR